MPLFPCVSWEFVCSQQVPSTKEASHPSWEPQVSRAAGGCPSECSACQISASPSPALFIYLLNPRYAHSPVWIPACAALTLVASPCCLLGSPHRPMPLGWVLWPWVRVTVGQLGKKVWAEQATAHSFLGRNSAWSLCQVPVLDAHGCSPS